jgi:hypothetical protein
MQAIPGLTQRLRAKRKRDTDDMNDLCGSLSAVSVTSARFVDASSEGAVEAGAVEAGAVEAGAVEAGAVEAGAVEAGTMSVPDMLNAFHAGTINILCMAPTISETKLKILKRQKTTPFGGAATFTQTGDVNSELSELTESMEILDM